MKDIILLPDTSKENDTLSGDCIDAGTDMEDGLLSLKNNSFLIQDSELKNSDTSNKASTTMRYNSDIRTINIPAGIKYLSEVMNELPENCIFNKGKVGCGGTTIAINSADNYIIIVPFISLIDSKTNKHENILGVDGWTDNHIIKTYNEKESVKKYMVTYNSFLRLINIVGTEGFKLLVDEYHLLFTQYSFRDKAIMDVLNNFQLFEYYCFMSATPLYKEFMPDEIKEIPFVNADWEEKDNITVNSIHCIDVKAETSYQIRRFIDDEEEGNAYFFINSIEFIKEMIEHNQLTNNNTRAIYSESNRKTLSIDRSSINSAPKKINFITSTAFEGADLEDENGKIFIISDGYKRHTLTDISTSFIQISGRIRNTQYKNTITHIYSKTRYSNAVSYEKYKRSVQKDITATIKIIDELNNLSRPSRSAIEKLNANTVYITRNKYGHFTVDINMIKLSLYNFKISKSLYCNTENLVNEYESLGFTVNKLSSNRKSANASIRSDSLSFKEKIIFLNESRYYSEGMRFITDSVRADVDEIINKDPWIDEAIRFFGFDGIEKEKYNITNIKRKLVMAKDESKHQKIFQLLEINGIREGEFYTNERIETAFTKAYRDAESVRAIRATDIKNYFETKYTQKRIGGKPIWGHLLISKKTLYVKR